MIACLWLTNKPSYIHPIEQKQKKKIHLRARIIELREALQNKREWENMLSEGGKEQN